MYHIGKKIKQLVDEKNIPILKIASEIDKSTTAIYDIYRKKDVNTEILSFFSKILDVPMSSFLGEYNIDDKNEFYSDIIEDQEKYLVKEKKLLSDILKELKNQLKVKDEQIKFLQNIIECEKIVKKRKAV